jgi:hypothetical protein
VPAGAGGYLARVAAERPDAARRPLEAFGGYLAADADLRAAVADGEVVAATATYQQGQAFTALTDAIDEAQRADQASFDDHVTAATDAASLVGPVGLATAGAALVLVLVGLYQRLREYRT